MGFGLHDFRRVARIFIYIQLKLICKSLSFVKGEHDIMSYVFGAIILVVMFLSLRMIFSKKALFRTNVIEVGKIERKKGCRVLVICVLLLEKKDAFGKNTIGIDTRLKTPLRLSVAPPLKLTKEEAGLLKTYLEHAFIESAIDIGKIEKKEDTVKIIGIKRLEDEKVSIDITSLSGETEYLLKLTRKEAEALKAYLEQAINKDF